MIGRILNIGFGICLLIISTSNTLYAQEVTATASVDTNQILIGDQFTYKVNVRTDKDVKILWPTFLDTIYHFEIVDRTSFDTLSKENNQIILEQSFVLTKFDSGYYPIPPIIFEYKKSNESETQTAETEALLIAVQTVAVDTAGIIRDIKPPIHVPMSFKELLPYLISVFGLFAIIVAIILLYKRYKNKKLITVKEKPALPAHVIAFDQLDKLKNENLWQKGKVKKYYSELSDITRLYIENRYKTPALEMTTDEIINSGLVSSLNEREKEELVRILNTSDLAKFAKANPLPNENELNWQLAHEFVDKTRIIESVAKLETQEAEPNV